MSTGDSSLRQAQLDKTEREDLEDVVTDLRELVEAEIEYELEHKYDLTEREGGDGLSDEEQATRGRLVEAIEHENPGDKSWAWCYEQYVTGVGYTIVNRLAAFRCMEVRDFLDRPVTQIGDSGLTPAAERVLGERFDLDRDEALVAAYHQECNRMEEEIEILFNIDSPYSLLDPEPDLFRDIGKKLDEIPEEVWRADDVLGWVYEYYNAPKLPEVRKKARDEGLDTEDVPRANQFYTPHWVVRMLTDNSLGKLYLESRNELVETVEKQERKFSADERKNRAPTVEESPELEDLCTYIVPTDEEGESTDFDDPEEIRVIDPACGSGHFLLYAFDVLERIWWEERPSLDRNEIPTKILEHNLYGVDLDLRACQLAAFNLYLKARSRAEEEGLDEFEMPQVGIVCADSRIAELEDVTEVFDEVASDQPGVREALESILNIFEDVHGLGSLLDVKGSLSAEFMEGQTTLSEDWNGDSSLSSFLETLREEIEAKRDGDSFLAQDLKSFLRLLAILSRDYDVALMNPPYGSHYGRSGRMPTKVKSYITDNYEYSPEFYINFFEVCDGLSKDNGRIGMLVPRSFMFIKTFQDFREDFVGEKGAFDFLAEFGMGVLDNATVRTVGTVIRENRKEGTSPEGQFFRLHDVNKSQKEKKFLHGAFIDRFDGEVQRRYSKRLSEFEMVPGSPITYWTPREIRSLYESEIVFDSNNAELDRRESLGDVVTGLQTGKNPRFVRYFWEVANDDWKPFAKGGEKGWMLPSVNLSVWWERNGREIKRHSSSRPQNTQYYFQEAVTYNMTKTKSGRRFGYLNSGSIFEVNGSVLISDQNYWTILSYANSLLASYLMLSQTPERKWEIGFVSRLPWYDELTEIPELEKKSKRITGMIHSIRRYEFPSPYYTEPLLLNPLQNVETGQLKSHRTHPHRELSDELMSYDAEGADTSTSLKQLNASVEDYWKEIELKISSEARETNDIMFEHFDIDEDLRRQILMEIDLRMDEDVDNPDLVPEKPEISVLVKRLLLHFIHEILESEEDGIVPLTETGEGEADLLRRMVEKFEEVWGEHAEERLVEVDEILGDKPAEGEAYPNLRDWLQNDLFEFHVETMENTPIIWKLTTERLVADSAAVGFACLVDYHQLDAGLFDSLSAQYLEPRKAELRERQSAADRRRNDESLTTSEQSDAVETYQYCTSALQQIAELETAMKELVGTNECDFNADDRELVQELAPKVATFRDETAERIDTLEELRERNNEDWFKDTFSDKFWDTVDEWRDEWLDGLDELERACEEYAKPSDEPVEAHLADLFDYFNRRLKGSDHYSSSGILFLTYYFEREGADLLDDDGEPFEHLSPDEQRLASLAMGLNDPSVLNREYFEEMTDDDQEVDELPPLAEYKALAEEIDDRCQDIHKRLPSQWKNRALSEITTAGYQPNHKHGVAINITPLAEQDIVPEVVEERVI